MRLAMKLDWRIVAPLLIVIAGILWGVIGLFSTALSSAGLEPVQITVVRCTIAACFLGIVLAIFKPHAFKIHLRHIWVFLGAEHCFLQCLLFCLYRAVRIIFCGNIALYRSLFCGAAICFFL